MAETLGFIGLGNMGEHMAANLMAAGYALKVYNRTASKCSPLAAKGATVAKDPAEVAIPGGIVMTMVSDDHAIEELCLGPISFVEKFYDDFVAHLDGKPCPFESKSRLVTA